MSGIFDTGIFDTGIFDHAAASPPVTIPSVNPDRIGGAGWKKKKKPKKEEIVHHVVEEVVEAAPPPVREETRAIAQRMAEDMSVRQLQEIRIATLVARIKAEIAEMDDEDVLLLAA